MNEIPAFLLSTTEPDVSRDVKNDAEMRADIRRIKRHTHARKTRQKLITQNGERRKNCHSVMAERALVELSGTIVTLSTREKPEKG